MRLSHATPTQNTTPRRRWLRRLLLCLLVLIIVGVAGGWYITRPARLARITSSVLEKLTDAHVQIASAHIRGNGTLELHQFKMRTAALRGKASRLIEIEHVRVRPDYLALLIVQPRLSSVHLHRPQLHLTQNLDTGQYNYETLPLFDSDGDTGGSVWLPEVFIRGGSVHFAEVRGGNFEPTGELQLQGKLTQWGSDPNAFAFTLRQLIPGQDDGPMVSGMLNLQDQHVSASLEGFRFDEDQRRLLPERLRLLWDRLNPTGSLPNLSVSYNRDADGGLVAELAVEDIALNLPVEEIDARFSHVTGRFLLEDDTLTIDNLTGEIEGIHYTINGEIRGRELDAPLHLSVETQPFVVPKDPPILPGLPDDARKHYERFSPSGTFRLAFDLDRPTAGGNLNYAGTLELLGVQGRYYKFPYPFHDLRGLIRFDQDQVVIEELRGKSPGGGELAITGTITPPGDGAAVDVHVVANNVAVNRHLLDAMEPKHRKVFDMFFDEAAHQDLVARGVIRSEKGTGVSSSTAADLPPVFDLGGRINAVIDVHRDFGPNKRNQVTTRLTGVGVNMLFRHWRYPLQITGGEVVIAPEQVIVNDITVSGPSGGVGTLRGTVDRAPRDKGVAPNLTITDARFPVDDFLLASIPSPQDQWVRQLHIQGALLADGRVFQTPPTATDEDGRLEFAINFTPHEATATPYGGSFTIEGLTGGLTLRRDSVTLRNIAGRRGEGMLSVAGDIAWPDDSPRYTLTFSAEDLAPDLAVLDLLPPGHSARPRLAELFDTYQPTGRLGAELVYTNEFTESEAQANAADSYRLTLFPQTLAFNLRDKRVSFSDITGSVLIDGDRAELDDVTARFEHGSLTASGLLGLDGSGDAALNLAAQSSQIDATTRAFLPDAALTVIDSLELTGGYRLEAARLLSRPHINKGPRLEFEGRIGFSDAAASVGVPITALNGELDLRVVQFAGVETPHVNLALKADALRAASRLIQPLTLTMATDENLDRLHIGELHGESYGGVITGSGSMQMTPRGQYRLNLALQDVQLEPFLAPETADAAHGRSSSSDGGGRVSANLGIEARYGDPATRQGRGILQVRDAELFKRPLAMALLQTANFALPTSGSFDRAYAHYLIMGDTVRFDRIGFETPNVAIAGKGTMDFPSRTLDLTMFARSLGGPSLGIVSEMINVFKDQLICIEVSGTLEQPHTRIISFEGLRESWRDIFGSPVAAAAPEASQDMP